MATPPRDLKLPEGVEILDLGDRDVKSVDVALEMAAFGASEEMVRAVGGDEAVARLHGDDNRAAETDGD